MTHTKKQPTEHDLALTKAVRGKGWMRVVPRGFANEWVVFRISPNDVHDAEQVISDFAGDANGYAEFLTQRRAAWWRARHNDRKREYRRRGHPHWTEFHESVECFRHGGQFCMCEDKAH